MTEFPREFMDLLPATGFLVDIGARLEDSSSAPLIASGWRALLIEPERDAFEELVDHYNNMPFVQVLNVGVGFFNGVCPLLVHGGNSTVLPGILPQESPRQLTIVTTLTWIFRILGIRAVDLLLIDAEGSDADILLAYDFSVKPFAIVYEDYDFKLKPIVAPWLTEHGYQLVAESAGNCMYVRTPDHGEHSM